MFLDEISTGLDSSTTFQIVRSLRHFAHIREATLLIALLQPTPETYHLFDDIMLLSEGELTVLPGLCVCTFCTDEFLHVAFCMYDPLHVCMLAAVVLCTFNSVHVYFCAFTYA